VCSLWHLPSGALVTNYAAGLAINMDMRIPLFSADGTHLLLGDHGVIRSIDLETGAQSETSATTEGNGVTALALSPDGRLLAAPTFGGGALVWDIGSRRQIAALEQLVNPTISVAFSPDGKRLVTGSKVGGDLQPALEIWDYVAQRGLLSLHSQGRFTGWTEFSPDGNTLLALSWHGLAELWRAPSWAEIETAEKE
jgi:WD40 repeat protein